jgi:enoyl-CoA hydratase
MSVLTLARDRGVTTVTVDAPPVNAMGSEVLSALHAVARDLEADAQARAIVLTGTGDKAFMAGADITEFNDLLAKGREGIEAYTAWTAEIFAAWRRLPQPVIAAAQANALGGGLEMAMVCDVIVLDEGARVGLPEVRLGLIPGGGGTQRLAARVGAAHAKRLMMLGAALTAVEARELGVVDIVAPAGTALETATALALRLAELPALAVQAIKQVVDAPQGPDLGAGLQAEREAFMRVFASADFREGYTAFLEKRAPAFAHR